MSDECCALHIAAQRSKSTGHVMQHQLDMLRAGQFCILLLVFRKNVKYIAHMQRKRTWSASSVCLGEACEVAGGHVAPARSAQSD
eukprot:1150984-Pelagomonas_calceolata.AAC.3